MVPLPILPALSMRSFFRSSEAIASLCCELPADTGLFGSSWMPAFCSALTFSWLAVPRFAPVDGAAVW